MWLRVATSRSFNCSYPWIAFSSAKDVTVQRVVAPVARMVVGPHESPTHTVHPSRARALKPSASSSRPPPWRRDKERAAELRPEAHGDSAHAVQVPAPLGFGQGPALSQFQRSSTAPLKPSASSSRPPPWRRDTRGRLS